MALRLMDFVSEHQIEEDKELYKDGPRLPDRSGINERPLFEILRENKDKKDSEFTEKFKHRPPKALDDAETEFLDAVETHKTQMERQRQLEENEQLLSFQAALANRTVLAEEPRTFSPQADKRDQPLPKTKRPSVLPISVKIKPIPKKPKVALATKEFPAEISGKPATRELPVETGSKPVSSKPEGSDEHSGAEDEKKGLLDSGLLGISSYGSDSDED